MIVEAADAGVGNAGNGAIRIGCTRSVAVEAHYDE